MSSLHQRRTHPVPVDGCWACRIGAGPYVAPAAAPTSTDASYQKLKQEERNLTVDGEAYKRLRRDGYQPKGINGSAHLEQHATTRFEIESGRVFSNASQGKEALTFFEDTFGRTATTPNTTPINSGDAA